MTGRASGAGGIAAAAFAARGRPAWGDKPSVRAGLGPCQGGAPGPESPTPRLPPAAAHSRSNRRPVE